MNQSTDLNTKKTNLIMRIKQRISLQGHIDTEAAMDAVKSGQTFSGPNVYILAFAIVIASVGLNVNSIPVIIGAMLISPLMGPIVGIGLSLGTNHFKLLKESLKNLFTMVVISIAASTLYFILSPLKLENPTELLARTNPTIYDVLIALFGGLAGILEISRKEKGTVMSGVAIATALMPPLCTIGYGIASLNAHYALGALYLFFINSVFIALAAFAGAKYLGFKPLKEIDPAIGRKNRRRIGFAILVMIIPSVFSAVDVVKQNNFERSANEFVKSARVLGKNFIYDYKISHDESPSTIELFVATGELDPSSKETLYALASEQGILRSQILINTNLAGSPLNTNKLASEIIARNEAELSSKDTLIAQLRREIDNYTSGQFPIKQIETEIRAQHPELKEISIASGMATTIRSDSTHSVVMIQTKPALGEEQKAQLKRWLSARTGIQEAIITE